MQKIRLYLVASIVVFGLLTLLCAPLLQSFFRGSSASAAETVDPSVDFVQIGLTGSVGTDPLITELDGAEVVILGTSKGIYVITEGDLTKYIPTSGTVIDMSLTDANGDGVSDVVAVVDDTDFPNVRCYDVLSGQKLWHYVPKQDVFLANILWTQKQTPTFDITLVKDVNADGIADVAVTSGYYCYMLNGKTGEQLWSFNASDNLWRVTAIDDINGDGVDDVATGAQKGYLYAISGADGKLVWKKKVADQGLIYDETGSLWATMDRSVWEILPVTISGEQKLIVSSEDAKVRLINPIDGTYEWESEALIEYSASTMFLYYRQKSKLPTSPGDAPFFNLRLAAVDDVNDDAIADVLAATYVGQSGGQGASALSAGLFMIDMADGTLVWNDTGLNMGGIARVEPLTVDDQQVILVPQQSLGSQSSGSLNFISLADGEATGTLGGGSGSGAYWITQNDDGNLIAVSNSADLMCVETDGTMVWNYPRVSDVGVVSGQFVGDGTRDMLIWSKHRLSGGGDQYGTRILYMVNGATRQKAWSYEIPFADLEDVQAIADLRVIPDLDGDGKQDILGYTYPQPSNDSDKNYKIMLFSGADGTLLLNQHFTEDSYYGLYEPLYAAKTVSPEALDTLVTDMLTDGIQTTYYDVFDNLTQRPLFKAQVDDFVAEMLAGPGEYDPNWMTSPEWKDGLTQNLDDREQERRIDKRIYSLDVIDVDGDIGLLVGCRRDVFIIDLNGQVLWTRTYNHNGYEDPFLRNNPSNFSMNDRWEVSYLPLGDVNGDDIDDMVAASNQGIEVLMSQVADGILNYRDDIDGAVNIFTSVEGSGSDPNQVTLVDDLDGDGVQDVSYSFWQEDMPQITVVASSADGAILLQTESQGGGGDNNQMVASADFDNDGFSDYINFNSWSQEFDRPLLSIISGDDKSNIWQYDKYIEAWVLNDYGIDNITPAAQIDDINDDGVADLVLGSLLAEQPGAKVEVYDVVKNELIKEITLEDIDLRITWERRWNPCAAIQQVGDYNGDGVKEVAITTLLTVPDSGGSQEGGGDVQKQLWLMVIDLENEMALAEFTIMASQFIDTGVAGELGVIGANGEIYFLNMLSDLNITSPVADSVNGSPMTVAWEGVEAGAYNQVFIDNVEVARTNGNEVTIDVTQGKHRITVRSMDEYGRAMYTATDFEVTKGAGMVMYVGIALAIVVLIVLYPMIIRLFRRSYKGGSDDK